MEHRPCMTCALIWAVHGHYLWEGLCYPAGAGISVAVEGAFFGTPEAKLGVVGSGGDLAHILLPQVQRGYELLRNISYCGGAP